MPGRHWRDGRHPAGRVPRPGWQAVHRLLQLRGRHGHAPFAEVMTATLETLTANSDSIHARQEADPGGELPMMRRPHRYPREAPCGPLSTTARLTEPVTTPHSSRGLTAEDQSARSPCTPAFFMPSDMPTAPSPDEGRRPVRQQPRGLCQNDIPAEIRHDGPTSVPPKPSTMPSTGSANQTRHSTGSTITGFESSTFDGSHSPMHAQQDRRGPSQTCRDSRG